jgi:hypothetical protein
MLQHPLLPEGDKLFILRLHLCMEMTNNSNTPKQVKKEFSQL